MLPALLAALIALPPTTLALPAIADEVTGEILAYDRLANLVVMRDRTVFELGTELMVPADLQSGDRVRIVYESAGEDGITAIDSLERVEG